MTTLFRIAEAAFLGPLELRPPLLTVMLDTFFAFNFQNNPLSLFS